MGRPAPDLIELMVQRQLWWQKTLGLALYQVPGPAVTCPGAPDPDPNPSSVQDSFAHRKQREQSSKAPSGACSPAALLLTPRNWPPEARHREEKLLLPVSALCPVWLDW